MTLNEARYEMRMAGQDDDEDYEDEDEYEEEEDEYD